MEVRRLTPVSVLIPSLCGGHGLVSLVEALTDPGARPVEVLIADNGLSQKAVRELSERRARVVPMGKNVGFGAAVNRLVPHAEGTLLAVLNDDISVEDGFLEALVAPLELGASASAGVLVREECPTVIETAGIVIDRFLGSYDHLQGESVAILASEPPAPIGPCAGAGAWHREVFTALGGFDERFFAYCEDVDLAIRMSQFAMDCALATKAVARHAGSRTLGYHSLAKAGRVGHSRGALIAKYGLLRRPVPAAWLLSSELIACIELARRHRSIEPARSRVAGYRSGGRARPAVAGRPVPTAATVGLVDGLGRRYRRSLRRAR